MSSMRNAVHRPSHKERAQPLSRKKHGLLEKHKDYSLRARDHNAKKARLKILQQKANDRNPDEFHFGMMSSKSKDGVKITERSGTSKGMSQEVVRLLKTQDAGYLRNMANKARRERERLEQEMQILHDNETGTALVTSLDSSSGSRGSVQERHTVFTADPQDQKTFSAEDWFGTSEKGLLQSYNRVREGSPNLDREGIDAAISSPKYMSQTRQAEEEKRQWKEQRNTQKKHEARQEQRRQLLKSVKTREAELNLAIEELDQQRAQMHGTVGGVNKNGIKFKVRERKR